MASALAGLNPRILLYNFKHQYTTSYLYGWLIYIYEIPTISHERPAFAFNFRFPEWVLNVPQGQWRPGLAVWMQRPIYIFLKVGHKVCFFQCVTYFQTRLFQTLKITFIVSIYLFIYLFLLSSKLEMDHLTRMAMKSCQYWQKRAILDYFIRNILQRYGSRLPALPYRLG